MAVPVTRAECVAQSRGVRTGYALMLALSEPAREVGDKRLAVVGILCQVYALCAWEKSLGVERLYAIGTRSADERRNRALSSVSATEFRGAK